MTTRVIYRGPAVAASRLAGMFRAEGLEVTYEEPMERRSIDPSLVTLVFVIGDKILNATVDMSVEAVIKRALDKIRARAKDAGTPMEEAGATFEIESDPGLQDGCSGSGDPDSPDSQ
jgi:hypothetical protein